MSAKSLLGVSIAILFAGTAAGAAPPSSSCAGLLKAAIPGVRITAAEDARTPLTIPYKDANQDVTEVVVDRPFCRVTGVIRPTPASDIRFETWLPHQWNGDYFQAGNGGLAGIIRYPPIAQAMIRGFAASGTDDGTAGDVAALFGNPERVLDYRDRAVHLTAIAGQAVARAFYGRPARHRFFVGGSKGGQEGLNEVQRYPEDFDGVVALYPAARGEFQAAGTLWTAQQMTRTPGSLLREPQLRLLHEAVLHACAGRDGGRPDDGFLTDPRMCRFDPVVLQCASAGGSGCLTPDQVTAARSLYAGPARYPELRMLPGGEWPTLGNLHGWSVLDGRMVKAFGLEYSIGRQLLGKTDWTYHDFDIDQVVPKMAEAAKAPPGNSFDPNLRAFDARGGKLLLIQGWNDPLVPAMHAPLYWDMVVADQAKLAAGGDAAARTGRFLRLFMVPGYGHGYSGGLEPEDPLAAIVAWVKGGRAPDRLSAVSYADEAAWVAAKRAPAAYATEVYGAAAKKRPVRLRRAICAWPAQTRVGKNGVECLPAARP